MSTILIAGGNSGIGLQAAHDLSEQGHRLVLLGRDPAKGAQALASLGTGASFHAVDLSTHAGVRDAARVVLDQYDHLDAALHTTGVMTPGDVRTPDGLSLFFAVNYLSRYHLTQLLLPALRKAEQARVVMMTARIAPTTPVDQDLFPRFEQFDFASMRAQVQVANHHYAAHLARTEPGVLAGVVNAGAAQTDIFRTLPWYMRAVATLAVPVFYGSVGKAAHNAVQAAGRNDWRAPTYWDKPGRFDQRTPIDLDTATTSHVMNTSGELTSA
ncbi:SDR family NAD(P)-dependent oxidoreductase [Promicromonospora sp. NPDC050262]|uniref:SDR family NAD(P)-dependent oxidoreductase n=1 Tax=Promicromonospora sp. NPDC050262 TaxID=3155036 RepID=UPI00340AA1D2